MRYRNLKGLDIELSCLGLGGEQLGGHGWSNLSETELVKAIHKAVDSGVNFFDVAPIYGLGHSEEVLGNTLGARRKNVLIATKVGLTWKKNGTFQKFTDSSPANIYREIDMSLKRLKTDYIDIYQIHWPDSSTPIEDTMVAMEKLKKSGKIRCIGCCNFSLDSLKEALKYGQITTVQMPYNLVDRGAENNLLPFCKENDIATIAYTPIAKGLLTGKYDKGTRFSPNDSRSRHKYFQDEELSKNLEVVGKVKIVANKLNKTPAQIALRWVLENNCVTTAVFGAKNSAQVEENVIASDFDLSKENIELLNEAI